MSANLEEAMEQLTWWAEEAAAATTERNNWIRLMRERGGTLRSVAEAAGMSHSAVAKILAKA